MARKKRQIYCEKCQQPADFYKKGRKERVLVCSGSCGVLAHNPKPKKLSLGKKVKRALQKADLNTPFSGGAITELGLLGSSENLDTPNPGSARPLTTFEKAVLLEAAENRRGRC